MNIKKAIQFGLLIWATMFILASLLVGFNANVWAQNIVMWLVIIAIAWYAANKIKVKSLTSGLQYGAAFAVVGIILDLIITVRFTGTALFSSASYWLGYTLTLLTVLFVGYKSKN